MTGGSSADSAGGVTPSDYQGVQQNDLGDDGDGYDPKRVQYQIKVLMGPFQKVGDPMSPGLMTIILGLMGTFTDQNVGLDTDLTGAMNGFFSQIQGLSSILDQAHTQSDAAGGSGSGASEDAQYLHTIREMISSMGQNSYFTSGPGAQICPQILGQLKSLSATVCNAASTASSHGLSCGGLEFLWMENDGKIPYSTAVNWNPPPPPPPCGIPASTYMLPPDTTGITALTQGSVVTTSLFTGLSKSVYATMQADTSTETTEQDVLTNFMKQWDTFLGFINGVSRTG